MEQMPEQDSTTDFAKKRGKQKRLSLDEYAASLLQWLPSGIAASRAFQKTELAAIEIKVAVGLLCKARPSFLLSHKSLPNVRLGSVTSLGHSSLKSLPKDRLGSGGIRTHAPEETGALIQRLRPLGHATLSGLRFPGHFYRRKGLPNADFAE
ncbi:hypothetical protein Q8A67_020809 [Cirrhinus molitorella]|uniref:Uncharacterized protein n=1 Tax=Cirrhinus molitorella TaxID=172907 RepID=A0AA88P5W7_9TELE|nr:hypothetical protein Q8A67_020809 [Cirrhinus molitorella]